MPLAPRALSVTAITTRMSAEVPWVMKLLAPFSTQPSPSRTAVVRIAAASLPDPASVSPQAASLLAAGQRHDVALLLRLGAEHRDVRRPQAVVRGHRQGHRRIDPGQFLERQAVGHRGHAGAAVGLGDLDAHQPEIGELGQQIRREVLRLVPGANVGPDLPIGELAHAPGEQHLVFGQRHVEHGRSRLEAGRGPTPAASRTRPGR